MKKRKIAFALAGVLLFGAAAACGQRPADLPQPESAPAGASLSEEGVRAKNDRVALLEKSDYKGFAAQIQKAFADRDIDALAGLADYPVYVTTDMARGEGVIVENADQLKEMAGEIFSDDLCQVVSVVDPDGLAIVHAGVVMSGENGTPNVIFHVDDQGKMGITGISPKK